MIHVVALSGGKDSTAMALELQRREPRDYTYLITPTDNEPPEAKAHWAKLACILGKHLTMVSEHTLVQLIEKQNCLPSNVMRWCTRMLKIEPCLRWIRRQSEPVTLYVGLRADEEERPGLYASDVITDFPMRRWGWSIDDVLDCLYRYEVTVPWRMDCVWCFGQRLSQWRRTWQTHPELWAEGERYEALTGHTFRNPKRDTWPASMKGLREEFEKGRIPRGSDDQMDLFDEVEQGPCRVCTL